LELYLLYNIFNSSLFPVSYILAPVHQVRNGGIEGKVDELCAVSTSDAVGVSWSIDIRFVL